VKGFNERVDFGFGIVERKAGSGRRGEIEEFMERHCAVMACPNGDAAPVEQVR
jgi:molybdate-binding protein